jgi:hypothetical protein
MPPTLTRIDIAAADEAYRLTIETDDGAKLEIAASFEQLDLISEEIDRILNRDEESALSED